MSTPVLHSVHSVEAVTACLARAGDGDTLLLLEDGVFAALATHPLAAGLCGRPGRRVCALAEDLARRGLSSMTLAADLEPINMNGFVALAVAHTPIVAWF